MSKSATVLLSSLLVLTAGLAVISDLGGLTYLIDITAPIERHVAAGPSYMTLDGSMVREGVDLQQAERQHSERPLSDKTTFTIPPDGKTYSSQLEEFKQAVDSGIPGRLLGVPKQFSMGYPVYPASCVFFPDHAECQTDEGLLVDEDYLVNHTTVVRNADVLFSGLTCGKICVDADGRVLGYVSKEMTAWRDQHCTWKEYGAPKCNTQP